MADRILGDKVLPMRVDLVSIEARRKDVVGKGKSVKYVLDIEPSLESEDDKTVALSCNVRLAFEERGPFEIDLKYKARYRKVSAIDGKELIAQFNAISYPILAEASMMISGISRAMGLIPLVLSPEEMIELANKPSAEKEG